MFQHGYARAAATLSSYLSELDFFSQFETNWIFFPVQTDFFSSFMSRVKYFDGPCLMLNYLLPFYNLQRYALPVSGLVDSLQPLV